jgi:hypothetical protein
MFIMNFLSNVRAFRVGYRGVLYLGLIMVYVCYEFDFQCTRLRVGQRGVLGSGLIMVYVYY